MSSLLVAQVALASAVQKQGGSFVLKMFDMFSKVSVQILYLLSVYYEKVSIVKPNTSRYANSERYVVAQGFRPKDGRKELTIMFLDKFCELAESNVISLFDEEVPRFFLNRLEECNAIIGQQQMDTIVSTINLIRNPRQDKIEKMRVSNIQKCVHWCQKHRMPFTRDVRQVNMFLSAKNKISRVPRKQLEGRDGGNRHNDCDTNTNDVSGYEAWKSMETGFRVGSRSTQFASTYTNVDSESGLLPSSNSSSVCTGSEASSESSSHGDRRHSDAEQEELGHTTDSRKGLGDDDISVNSNRNDEDQEVRDIECITEEIIERVVSQCE
jgi:hypothetical protein